MPIPLWKLLHLMWLAVHLRLVQERQEGQMTVSFGNERAVCQVIPNASGIA